MEDYKEPPEKRARHDDNNKDDTERSSEGGHSFEDILVLLETKISENSHSKKTSKTLLVKQENFDQQLPEESEEKNSDVDPDVLKLNFLSQFESLGNIIKNVLRKKESDYYNLELELDATLERLEQYEENSEEAKREIVKKRNIISNLEAQLLIKNEKLSAAESEIQIKSDKLKRAEKVLLEYVPIANNNKVKISELEKDLELTKKQLEEARSSNGGDFGKELEITKIDLEEANRKLTENDEKFRRVEKTLKMSSEKIKNALTVEKSLKNTIEEKDKEIQELRNELLTKSESENNQEHLEKMVEMQRTLILKENEITNLKSLNKAAEEKEKNRGNFFVLNNEESNDLSRELEERKEELDRVNEENNDLVNLLNEKETEIKVLDGKIKEKDGEINQKCLHLKEKDNELSEKITELKEKSTDVQRLNQLKEKMFTKLKEKDRKIEEKNSRIEETLKEKEQVMSALKSEYKKHFEELNRRYEVMARKTQGLQHPAVGKTAPFVPGPVRIETRVPSSAVLSTLTKPNLILPKGSLNSRVPILPTSPDTDIQSKFSKLTQVNVVTKPPPRPFAHVGQVPGPAPGPVPGPSPTPPPPSSRSLLSTDDEDSLPAPTLLEHALLPSQDLPVLDGPLFN